MKLSEAAKQAAGNWQKFDSFAWFRRSELEEPEKWAIIYTHNRDSGLLDQSNGQVIAEELAKFAEGDDPDVVFESHNHWAVGHVDGFSIRVYKKRKITEAFRVYHELAERMENYPILDEADYSEREYDATLIGIFSAAGSLKHDYELPEGWQDQVYSWLSENEETEIENCDDQGGYPSEEAIERAFEALGFKENSDSTVVR